MPCSFPGSAPAACPESPRRSGQSAAVLGLDQLHMIPMLLRDAVLGGFIFTYILYEETTPSS